MGRFTNPIKYEFARQLACVKAYCEIPAVQYKNLLRLIGTR